MARDLTPMNIKTNKDIENNIEEQKKENLIQKNLGILFIKDYIVFLVYKYHM